MSKISKGDNRSHLMMCILCYGNVSNFRDENVGNMGEYGIIHILELVIIFGKILSMQ